MIRSLFILLASVLAPSLLLAQSPAVTNTIFLVGDAGEPYVKDDPISRVLPQHIAAASGEVTVLFLGDNIYPSGLPDRNNKRFDVAQHSLETQIQWLNDSNARGIFIPGNHDWQHWGKKGWEYILHQQAWLDSLRNPRVTSLPRNGCPGPVQIPLNDRARLVILDTQWILHEWEKPQDPELCDATDMTELLIAVEDIFRSHPNERIIVAAHHPLITYGEHGGVFTWKAHLFPLEEAMQHLYLPMPVLGSLYPLYRKWFGHLQDTRHAFYREFAGALMDIMKTYPNTVYVAGHEHALQYIVKDGVHYIVSGSASKTEYVKKKGHAVFAEDVRGYAVLTVYDNGATEMTFWQVDDDHPEGIRIFDAEVPAPAVQDTLPASPPDYTGVMLTTRASDKYAAGRGHRFFFGDNYRSAWTQEVEVPIFDIGQERGGLRIVQKGGGQQTLSLRLADSAGREYVLRSIEKYPQQAIPEPLRETFAQDVVQDQISASHPYAAIVVAPMAEALGLYHTNPRVVYVPDDERLGPYRPDFANMLALFEERPDEDWSHAAHFGNSDNIIGTRRLLEKLTEDNDHKVDQPFVLRNRLFDFIIGDWDRHDDQWRWATIDMDKGNLYRPIPRDRDQAFFVNEGVVPTLFSRRWALPKFEGFDEEIDWPPGLAYNARHFDRSFLNELTEDDWVREAAKLRADLTDEIIEDAVRKWPPEIFELHGPEVIRKLKARRDRIVDDARVYYRFLARHVDVVGSDKHEAFDVHRKPNGDITLRVFKTNKEGKRSKLIYSRDFDAGITREIRLYGLGGNDRFQVSGEAKKSIRLRIIGGDGPDSLTDSSHVRSWAKKTFFYDRPGESDLRSSGEVRDLRRNDPDVNTYDRMSFEYDRLAPLIYGQYHPDDGVFLGAGFIAIKHGFRKTPFAQRHLFLASIAPRTESYNFRYQGKFTDFWGGADLGITADVRMPNYVNNFFGMGNASVFDPEIDEVLNVDDAIDYYRYRFRQVYFYPSLSADAGRFGTLTLGPVLQAVRLERSGGGPRLINDFVDTNMPDAFGHWSTFGGIAWSFEGGSRDAALFTRRGADVRITGRHHRDFDDTYAFSGFEGSVALFYSFTERSPLAFAGRIGGGVNLGDFPFYQAQILDGKTALRGFRKTRFYGDAMAWGNFEARLELGRFRSYLFPASMGLLGFVDTGRVWWEDEQADGSRRWHVGAGGGVWFTPFNVTILSVEVGASREGALGYVRLGFLF